MLRGVQVDVYEELVPGQDEIVGPVRRFQRHVLLAVVERIEGERVARQATLVEKKGFPSILRILVHLPADEIRDLDPVVLGEEGMVSPGLAGGELSRTLFSSSERAMGRVGSKCREANGAPGSRIDATSRRAT
jgi:hypothetical protein